MSKKIHFLTLLIMTGHVPPPIVTEKRKKRPPPFLTRHHPLNEQSHNLRLPDPEGRCRTLDPHLFIYGKNVPKLILPSSMKGGFESK